ncbi:hypothetical protein HRI_001647900 [Hibiscus trionum]|uniref:CCHC-type domain-containing protein n=1 Tax=Hibiscus trionum TaxID=183268 RepID=A0A9W7HM13_HIBTR|nr:hypothetical protein HRI_001647900 [Hibiscus trionum]
MATVEEVLAELSIEEEEEESALVVGIESAIEPISFEFCFVGSFFTSSTVNFTSMKATLANVWHPIGGIAISELREGRYLFRFYNSVDADRVEVDGPWYFNFHLLVMHRLVQNEEPMAVPLNTVDFWIRVNDLPNGFVSEAVAKKIGDFIGGFLEYDSNSVSLGLKGCMRIRVRVALHKSLKRRKKILLPSGGSVYVTFQYEKLKLFCFRCGKLGHGEGFCPLRVLKDHQDLPFQWDASLRAPARRRGIPTSPWLREEDGGRSRISRLEISPYPGKENLTPPNPATDADQAVTKNPPDCSLVGKSTKFTPTPNKNRAMTGFGLGPVIATDVGLVCFDTDMIAVDEDAPISHAEGLKRPRSSTGFVEKDASPVFPSNSPSTSAGLDSQARREP